MCIRDSLYTLLSEENQNRIADALRQYQAGEGSRMDEFKQALAKRIEEKQKQYKALLATICLTPRTVLRW